MNRKTLVLHVGDVAFSPVKPEVWDYSVSGLLDCQVVVGLPISWISSGRKSSPLD